MSSRNLGQLLRRFQLSPTATKADLKKAYLLRAKEVHPDVAGKSSEEEFRRLQEEYEAAMKAMREAESGHHSGGQAGGGSQHPGGYGWQAQGAHDWNAYYQQQYQHPYTGGSSASSARYHRAPPPPPLTAAQRIRNVLLAAGGLFGATMFFTTPRAFSSKGVGGGHLGDPSAAAGTAVGDAALARKASAPPREVSNYYKTRNTKSTVRVRGGDTYVSPAAAPKSRVTEEGLGSSVAQLGKLVSGVKPTEAANEPLLEPRQVAQQEKSAAAGPRPGPASATPAAESMYSAPIGPQPAPIGPQPASSNSEPTASGPPPAFIGPQPEPGRGPRSDGE